MFQFKWWQIVLGLVVFSFAVAAFAFIQRSSFSSDDIDIIIDGPQHIESGKEVIFSVGIENKTSSELLDVQLTIDLPSSLKTLDEKQFMIFRWETLTAGQRAEENLSLVGQGDSKDEEVIRGRVEYSPKGFSGRFTGSKEISLTLSALPITAVIDVPESVVPGQEVEGTIHLNAQEEILFSPLFVELHTPVDFVLSETNPKIDGEGRWSIEDIVKDQDYALRFRGIIKGVPGEDKDFRISVGRKSNGSFVALMQHSQSLHIGDAPLAITQEVLGTRGDTVFPGDIITSSLLYENMSSIDIENVTLEVFLSGAALDTTSVSVNNGSFDRRTNTITWSKSRVPELRMLESGARGVVSFSVSVRDNIEPININDTDLTVSIKARIHSPQRSLAFGGVSFEDQDSVVLKVAGTLSLTSEISQVDATRRTVTLKLANTTNNLVSVQVEGVLAVDAQWIGDSLPADESVLYIPDTRTVVWNVGDMRAGTGSLFSKKQVQFDVRVMPGSIDAMDQIKATATDAFTGSFLEDLVL